MGFIVVIVVMVIVRDSGVAVDSEIGGCGGSDNK